MDAGARERQQDAERQDDEPAGDHEPQNCRVPSGATHRPLSMATVYQQVTRTLNRPFPFQEIRIYDPQGRYENAGVPGPFYPGIWSGPRVRSAP
ncbi:MAG TPA: hypothetical protein VHL53_03220 [Acidimicrobiia bacterium]|nr:hypothetical protein [Acidimicrobiia bacterium]